MLVRIGFITILAVVLSACGSRGPRYYQDDGPHASVPTDLSQVKNAQPRNEPRSASGNNPYVVFGQRYVPLDSAAGYRKTGVASWYGRKFHGRRTSSGEMYDMYAMTAAHTTLPLPSFVKVRNLDNGKEVVVRVNDRGPFLHNRLIDLSYAAAYKLGVIKTGTARVEVTVVDAGTDNSTVAIGTVEPGPVAEPQPLEQPAKLSLVESAAASDKPVDGGVFLQVGSFSVWDNAIKLRDQLEQANIRPVTIATVNVKSARYFRVRVGPIDNLGQAEKINSQVRQLGIHDGRVIIE